MGYLNEDGLVRYDGLLKNWVTFKSGTVDGIEPLLNWQKTITASTVSFYPLPAAPLDSVVNFAFTETGPAEGTKAPDNPSTIAGVSEVKVGRVGKNLLLAVPDNTGWYGISITRQADGSYLLNGTSTSSQQRYFPITDCGQLSGGPYSSLKLDVAKTYTLSAKVVSGTIAGGASVSVLSTASPSWIPGADMQLESGVTKTATRSAASLVTGEFVCRLNVASGAAFTNVVLQVQLEEGDTATDFEAPMLPADEKFTVNLGGTYYGGSVDLSAGTMTVTQFSDTVNTLSSVASVKTTTVVFNLPLAQSYNGLIDNSFASNKFNCYRTSDDVEHISWRQTSAPLTAYLYIKKTRLDVSSAVNPSSPTDAEWLAAGVSWIQSNPVQVVACLSTPYTIQLTPMQIYSLSQPDPYTPRINTVYSDKVSVQVVYPKSPQATAAELTNAIISLGGNI